MFIRKIATATLVGLAAAQAAAARPDTQELPSQVSDMLACRSIADEKDRLACYDRTVGAFGSATESREVVVADRKQLRQAREDLFGLTLPENRLFASEDDSEEVRVDGVTSRVKTVRTDPRGRLVLTLENGSRWDQIDSVMLSSTVEAGQDIVIERAALGSFRAKIDGQRAIRVRRVN